MDNTANKPYVLLAEDEEMHAFPMQMALKRAGFEVRLATDQGGVLAHGKDAVALVIDARLPSQALEGLHAAARLVREGLPTTVPIIFISVYAEATPSVQQTLSGLPELSGRYHWLEKHFEPTNLVRLLKRSIDASHTSRSESTGV